MIIDSGYIYIDNIKIYAYHGVMEQERKVGANFCVSVKVKANLVDAILSDSIDDTVNYADLYAVVEREMAKPSALLEHVAGRIAQAIFDNFYNIMEASVKITKISPPAIANSDGAGVIIHAVNNKLDD